MVAFLIQPVSGECCVDPCSRSSPCDPCEPTTTTTTTTTTTLPPAEWVCVTDSSGFWSGKYEKADSILWEGEAVDFSIQYDGTYWYFKDEGGGESDLFATSSGGVDPSVPTWPSRITSVTLNGIC